MEEQQLGTTQAETGEAGDTGVLGSLGINGAGFIAQLLNFLIVLTIVWFLILKPLTKKMEERRKIIDESLDKAKEVETKLMMAKQAYQGKLDDAKAEANKIMAKAHDEAKVMGDKMKQEAKDEIAVLVNQARVKIQTEKEATILEIRGETGKLAVAIAEKLLEEKMDSKKDEELITAVLQTMKK